jgi:hypothetical protein
MNVDAHSEGYVDQTVSVILHRTDCPDPEACLRGEDDDHDHEPGMDM